MSLSSKIGVFFLIVLCTILAGNSLVSAADCAGGADQTILSLSGEGNAHGSLWSNALYTKKICYDSFWTAYAGANPHDCSAGDKNIVLRLSNGLNAHAQNASKGDYLTKVCYGDLRCEFVDGACPIGKTMIASLSGNTNAHISASGSYQYKICCSREASTPIPGKLFLYWMNSTGGKITNSYVNNTVQLVAETGLTSGIINFEVYEDDGGVRQNIRTGANVISAAIQSNGVASAIWEISDADIAAGAENDTSVSPSDPELEFYINASADGRSNVSGILKTSIVEGPASPPTAVIISPLNEEVYFVGNEVNFSQASYGESAFSFVWDVDDSTIDAAKKSLSSFSHVYTSPGVKKIVLNVTNKKGLSSTTSRNIVVLNISSGVQVVPIISAPAINSRLPTSIIEYNGSHSYVLNISGGLEFNVSCIGGLCPSQITHCPSGFAGGCPILVSNSLGLKGNYDSMNFNWTFVEGSSISSEAGNAKTSGTKIYESVGQKEIQLRINSFGANGFSSNPFEILTAQTVGCSSDRLWWYEGGKQYSTSADGYCGGADHKVGGSPDCCPRGEICTKSGSTIKCLAGECIQFANKNGAEYQIRLCDDYNYITGDKEDQCNADCNLASSSSQQVSAITDGLPGTISCSWVGGKCSASYTKQSTTIGGATQDYQCIMEVTGESACERNEKTVDYLYKKVEKKGGSWVVVPDTPDAKCEKSGSVKLRCGGSTIVLPVFSGPNFILTITCIVAIYGFLILIKNKKRE